MSSVQFRPQGLLKRAGHCIDITASPIGIEQPLGLIGQKATGFPAFSFNTGDRHVVIGGGLVPHPGDDGGLGALADGDTLGAGDGAAAHRCGMFGDSLGQSLGHVRISGMEGQEINHRLVEALDILGLIAPAPLRIGLSPFGILGRGTLDNQFIPDRLDDGLRCPDALGENLASFLLLNRPGRACRFDAACEGGIPWWHQHPIGRRVQHLAVGGAYRAGFRTRGYNSRLVRHRAVPAIPRRPSYPARVSELPSAAFTGTS